jgi:CheY-like chemotaxis protein
VQFRADRLSLDRASDKLRILLVEDEAIIALAIEDMLVELGCHVVGPALSLGAARTLADNERLDGAVLDINLGGHTTEEIARTLKSRGIPFCFSTGYGVAGVSGDFDDVPVLQKPYQMGKLAECLSAIVP